MKSNNTKYRRTLIAFISLIFTTLVMEPVWAHDFGGTTTSSGDPSQAFQDSSPQPGNDIEPTGFPATANSTKPLPADAMLKAYCDNAGRAGDPVSLYDGRYELEATDMVVKGLFPIEISRRYDSRSTYDSPLGYGWSFSHDRRLFEFPDGSVVIRYACGSRDRFVFTGGAYVTPDGGRQGDLIENLDGTFVYTRSYGTREYYDAEGRLSAVQNKFGQRHEYTYDPAGMLQLTGTSPFSIDPLTPMTVAYNYRLTRIDERTADGVLTGHYVTFAYDNNTGRVTTVTSADGRSVAYVHDTTAGLTKGNLVQVNGLEGIVATYQYNDPNDIHNLTDVQEEAGAMSWATSYDTQDRVIQQIHGNDTFAYNYVVDLTETSITHTIKDANGLNPYNVLSTYYFDANGDVSLTRDALGNEIEYLRDAQGNMTSKKFYENQGTVALPSLVLQRTINFGFDAYGRKAWESVTLDSGETVTKSWIYDGGWLSVFQAVSSADPSKFFRTEYTFYRDGQNIPVNIQSIKRLKDDGSHQTTSFTYDVKNRLGETLLQGGQKIVTLYEAGSLYATRVYYEVGAAPSPYGQMRFDYDAHGNLTKTWDGNDNLTQYAYDNLGRVRTSTNARSESTSSTYAGTRLTQVEVGRTTAGGEGQVTRLNYTSQGWLESVDEKDDLGGWQRVLTNTYNSAGKRLSTNDAQNRTVSYQYDVLGRLIAVTDPLNKSTVYGYDMFHNRVTITDANGNVAWNTYDDLDRISQVEQRGITPAAVTTFSYDALNNLLTVTDAENHATTYTYDLLSRVTAIIQPLGQMVQKYYDERNRVDYTVNARGNKIDYSYEPWGVVSSERYYVTTGSPTPDKTVSYSYDHALNLVSVTDDSIQPGPLYNYTYDVLNRPDVLSVSYLPGGNRTLGYGYDRYGNKNSLIFADGTALNHSYTYDKRNRLISALLPGNQNFSFNYYPSGELEQATYPNGVNTDYVYEANGPVQSITVAGTSGTLEQLSYTYDNILNVDAQSDSNGQYDYTYDGLDRLTQAVYPASTGLPTENYDYDAVSNREAPINAALYDYDNNNRIIQSPGLTYNFDADGNQIGRSDGTSLSFNQDNRLMQFTKGATTVTYKYDPMGRRISKTVNGVTTWFLWDGINLIAEFNGVGSRTKRYAYLAADNQLAQMEDAAGTYNVHRDRLEIPRLLTNSTGQVVWQSFQEAFGMSTMNEDPDGDTMQVVLDLRLPGQYYDHETNLHYNLNRYYDPEIGRFITSDPIGLAGGYNTYAYVGANPVRWIDPLGLKYMVNVTGNTITVSASITIYGPNASDVLAEQWQEDINNIWNSYGAYHSYGDNCQVVFDVNVTADPDHNWWFTAKSANNKVYVVDTPSDEYRSHVKPNANYGRWSSTDSGKVAAHETGHFFMLPDAYGDNNNDFFKSWDIMADLDGSVLGRHVDDIVERKHRLITPWSK